MDKPVDDGGRHDMIIEDPPPFVKDVVAREDGGASPAGKAGNFSLRSLNYGGYLRPQPTGIDSHMALPITPKSPAFSGFAGSGIGS
jgi:hypothetical protein